MCATFRTHTHTYKHTHNSPFSPTPLPAPLYPPQLGIKAGDDGGYKSLEDGDVCLRRVEGISTAVSAAAGTEHSIVVTGDGKALACGQNNNGQCGLKHTKPSDRFLAVVGLTGIVKATAGAAFTLFLVRGEQAWTESTPPYVPPKTRRAAATIQARFRGKKVRGTKSEELVEEAAAAREAEAAATAEAGEEKGAGAAGGGWRRRSRRPRGVGRGEPGRRRRRGECRTRGWTRISRCGRAGAMRWG